MNVYNCRGKYIYILSGQPEASQTDPAYYKWNRSIYNKLRSRTELTLPKKTNKYNEGKFELTKTELWFALKNGKPELMENLADTPSSSLGSFPLLSWVPNG